MAHHSMEFTCPSCDDTVEGEFDIDPEVRGRYSGPPELCYPSEGGVAELTDPLDCPECDHAFTAKERAALEEKAYIDWVEAQEPDEPDDDEGPPFRY